MELLKDDSTAGTSDEHPEIKEEVLINNEYDIPKKIPKICKDASEEERTFHVTFLKDGKKHLVRGRLTDSILSALRSSKYVCEELDKNKTREFHLIEKKEPMNVCVNLGMPLKYLSDCSQFEVKFYSPNKETDGVWYRQYDAGKEECIVFYVHGKGSRMETHATQSRRLMKNKQLPKEYCIFCIFAPKGESIKDALCNDGRFLPLLKETDWALVKEGKFVDNDFLVNNLSDQVYEIEVQSKKGARYSGDLSKKQNDLNLGDCQPSTLEKPQPQPDFEEGQLSASEKQQPEPDCEQGQFSTSKKQQQQYFEWQILQLYPKLKEERQKFENFLRGKKKDALEVYKRNFGKEINDSFSVKLLRTLGKHAGSIGYIEWRSVNLETFRGCATCFVLHGRYILTCHHVVRRIVGEGIEAKDWGNIIKQSSHVTFSYEDKKHIPKKRFSLENWFEIGDKDLDFAVLKLEENESHPPPPGLLQLGFPQQMGNKHFPANGPIFIIGHPNGQIKSVDVCLVVSIFDRNKYPHLQQGQKSERNTYDYSREETGIHMYNPKDFERERNNPNIVTYNTCFLWGSSGSPVFNKDGQLVALHSYGFGYDEKNKYCGKIEYGFLIHSIILKIQSKFKSWYDAVIAPDAREDSSHVDASLSEAEEEMDCT